MTSSLQGLRLGDYTVNGKISKGARGCVFLGQRSSADLNSQRSSGERKQDQGPAAAPSCVFTAVKYPANNREVRTMRALHTAPACMGVPLIFDSGLHGGKPWLAMELLGSPLAELIKDLRIRAPKQRWMCICVLGHLLLRRLRAIHERGFVHCDINDTNVMIGRKYGNAMDRYMPFFVDFGLAHPHPGGDPIQAHAGTIEFNSIRSTDGGPRLPRDDVEAVGWLLCYAFLGNLFWFRWIEEINWKDKPRRAVVCKRVQQAKLQHGILVFRAAPCERQETRAATVEVVVDAVSRVLEPVNGPRHELNGAKVPQQHLVCLVARCREGDGLAAVLLR
mmetsp:Transcript_33623/g.96622  ORF Transcript_33623/g.96622 Transcript_33623/m.96622 type:complete len:334 (-) Transcript_33623:598-1599(-)